MMEFINAAYKWKAVPRATVEPFVLLLSPFAPHIAEELWQVEIMHSLARGTTRLFQPTIMQGRLRQNFGLEAAQKRCGGISTAALLSESEE